jgi:tRNA (guanine26-N2/guanine27-N2)-dimethyltransferase
MEAEVIIEGRTSHRLPPTREDRTEKQLDRHGKGPADRSHRSVFHNPAMAGCRTRSVLLMDHMLSTEWLGKPTIHTIDALCATGSRINRWVTELPPEKSKRLQIVGADLDEEALEYARKNCPSAEFVHGDSRRVLLSSGWQWIDIDPFGSPLPFLDAAMQSSARKAVMEITATDTAALTGSTKTACMRRYGARIRCDEMAHDSALRLLMATVARAAARHDRAIAPLLASWDSHHIRVSVRTMRSIETANVVEECLGWRIASPTDDELVDSVEAGLHPQGPAPGQPFCLLPLSHSVNREDKRISGPLWTGPLFDAEALAAMTVERAIELCGDNAEPAVRHWAGEADLAGCASLIITDMLPRHCDANGPPPLAALVERLQEMGHRAAIARWGAPAIRTDAPWPAVLEATEACAQPPM